MKTPDEFKLTEEQRDELAAALKKYFSEELDLEIGDLQATLFVDFLNQKVGRHYYNAGIMDVIKVMNDNTENLVLLLKE